MPFRLPPRLSNERGEPRKVGFELEFGGLPLEQAASILQNLFGGEVQCDHRFSYFIKGTKYGDFAVEADSRFLKERRYRDYIRKLGIQEQSLLAQNVEGALEGLAGILFPFEIVTPPLPLQNLEPIELLRSKLQMSSAKGTRGSLFSAFGMQFNPEVPDQSVETLLAYLRSFFLLFDWLFEESDIAFSRKITPFINSFPDEYVEMVLNPEYRPDLRKMMCDYLTFNPTRNRPLDLLPLFTYIDRDLVFQFEVEKDLIKSRPTFHYRLPNSEVDDPHWTIAEDWNNWVEIETLAENRDLITRMTNDFLDTREEYSLFPRRQWVQKTRDWLHAEA